LCRSTHQPDVSGFALKPYSLTHGFGQVSEHALMTLHNFRQAGKHSFVLAEHALNLFEIRFNTRESPFRLGLELHKSPLTLGESLVCLCDLKEESGLITDKQRDGFGNYSVAGPICLPLHCSYSTPGQLR